MFSLLPCALHQGEKGEREMETERSYDYPAKNAVREAWMRFLPLFAMRDLEHPIRGLYLPSTQNLELSGYLAKGMDPNGLIGVEHDPRWQDRIEMHGHKIALVRGTIQDAVQMVRDKKWYPLTFANFDFEGSYHTFIRDVLSVFSVLPAQDASYITVSSYCARDDDALLQGIINTSKFYSTFDSSTQFWSAYGRMKDRYSALRRQLSGGGSLEEHTHLSRELGFLWWIALALGTIENRNGTVWSVTESYMETFDDILQDISRRVSVHTDEPGEFRVLNDPRLSDRLKARTCSLWPDRFEHYVWFTAQHQPMRTWMIRIQPIEADSPKPTHFEIIEQLWNMATRTPLVYFTNNGTKITFE